MTEAPHLLEEEDQGVFIVTLNRPEKLNALSDQMMALFEQAVLKFRDTPELKVMLIQAKGRFFSSGADLKEIKRPPPQTGSAIREVHRVQMRRMHYIYDEMEAIEKPIVAAHQAACVGGGLEMSMSCDFRLAAKSASYAFPEGKFGLLPASNGVSRLTRLVGTQWARYLVMANLPINAERALMIGLVHDVFPDETFEQEVMAFCRHLAQQNGEQMGCAKLAIEMAADLGLAQARNVERMANSTLMLHPKYQEYWTKHLETIGKNNKP
ncbi:MAG: enoyl-CoA hydratase/isomerase family protein [Hyphomonadaceae bacterium]|nr:enoyl-CoA hydratase/isomerase family protein [Hyphomonadaceae bacterium]